LISTWDTEQDAAEILASYKRILTQKHPSGQNINGTVSFGIKYDGLVSCIVKKGTDLIIYDQIPEDLLPQVFKASIDIKHIK
jgi:hypothetical protein